MALRAEVMNACRDRDCANIDIDGESGDHESLARPCKRQNTAEIPLDTSSEDGKGCSIAEEISIISGVRSLCKPDYDAVLVRRRNIASLLNQIDEYMESGPVWPNTDEHHPMDATIDRVALIDFSSVTSSHTDPLAIACAYGRNLPPRCAVPNATARMGVAEVLSVLPEGVVRSAVTEDAEAMLLAVWKHTQVSQLQLRLEFIRGDTCQKWHRDVNTLRCIFNYVGPGTHVAEEACVERGSEGEVLRVSEEDVALLKHANAGDIVLMKGGLWPGKAKRGAAHRAPPIGPVGTCRQQRLVLKVDVMR